LREIVFNVCVNKIISATQIASQDVISP